MEANGGLVERSRRVTLLALVVLLVTGAPSLADQSAPPTRFNIEDFSIQLVRAHYTWECPSYTVAVTGNGEGLCTCDHLDRAPVSERFAVSRTEVVALLDLLFKYRFFDLSEHYDGFAHFKISPAGSVRVSYGKIRPSPGQRSVFTVAIGEYIKTVTVGATVLPSALESLERQIDRVTPKLCLETDLEESEQGNESQPSN